MKSLLPMIAAAAMAMLTACSQDPRMAALEKEMQAGMQQMMAMGASQAQIEAYRMEMIQKAQTLQTSMATEQMSMMAPGGYPEPTEDEMRSVFEGTLGNAKSRVDAMADQCNNVRSTNDPSVGLACLFGKVGQSQQAQVGISSFRKIACEKSSKPGWNCDYIIGVSARALSAFGGGGSEAQSKRFVKSDGRWIAMDY